MCVLLPWFIEPRYFSYTYSMIIIQNEWPVFMPVVLPVVDVFRVPYFEFSTLDMSTMKFQNIGNSMSDMK